jgi:hypothetical protein
LVSHQHATEGSLTKLLTEKFENITKNADNTENGTLKGCDKNYKNSRFKVIDFLSLQQPYEVSEMTPTTVMMMMVSPEPGKPKMTNFNDSQNGDSHYQDSDEMFDLDISEDESNDEIAKTNGNDSFSESASTDSLASSKMWQKPMKNGYQEKYSEKLTAPVIINKNFSKNSKFSNSKMTSTNDNFINFNNTSSDKYNTKNDTQQLLGTMKNSNIKKNMVSTRVAFTFFYFFTASARNYLAPHRKAGKACVVFFLFIVILFFLLCLLFRNNFINIKKWKSMMENCHSMQRIC